MDSSTSEVTPTLLADQVFEVLRDKILTGELPGGSPLRVRNVADMVGTSVMPVREAIRRLGDLGLASHIPHRGAVVREFTLPELIHIYEVRALLEVDAAVKGVQNISEEAVATMLAAADRMDQAVERAEASEALDEDEVIHRTLYEASGNPVLVEMIEMLWLRCRPYKYLGAAEALAKHDDSLWSSQRMIIQAVGTRRPIEVTSLINKSLTSARRRLEDRLSRETE